MWAGAVTSYSSEVSVTVNDPDMSETAYFEYDDGGGGNGDPLSKCGLDTGCAEPLLIRLSDGPWRLAGLEDPVAFDINAQGKPRTMGWTKRGDLTTAFLALDRNGNHRIDDGTELFGNATPTAYVSPPANGFQALRLYDENADGVIDSTDSIWPSLLLWVDANHNGVSEPDELSTISRSGITAIGVLYQRVGRHDQSGNTFVFQGKSYLGNQVRTIYDVFFVVQ